MYKQTFRDQQSSIQRQESKASSPPPSPITDTRTEAIQMRKLQELANNSPKTQQLSQLQKIANRHTAGQELPVQKKPTIPDFPISLKQV